MSLLQFRKIETADFHLLHKWHNQAHVKQWYDKDKDLSTLQAVVEKYNPILEENKPTQSYIILSDERPIGYIQTYRINDYPDYGKHVGLTEEAAGLDLFIGDAEYLHRGLGSEIIQKFLKEIIFADTDIESCIVGPEPKNTSAIRAYEKAGFKYLKTVQLPDEPEPEYLMRIRKV